MWNWIGKIEELRKTGAPFAIITVTQVTGSSPREPGAKMVVGLGGKFFGSIGGGQLELRVLEEVSGVLQDSSAVQAKVVRYPLGAKTGQCCGGIVEVLVEPMNCGPHLYLFGAGHVGQAVCRSLQNTPFTVHLVDDRAEWIESPSIPAEVLRHYCEWDDFTDSAIWSEQNTYVAVMTYRHDMDQEIINFVIQKPARYIGLIGSQSKWLRFQQRLALRGASQEALNRVKCPLGIPIGGKAPQEIAISLAAELLQVYYGSLETEVIRHNRELSPSGASYK